MAASASVLPGSITIQALGPRLVFTALAGHTNRDIAEGAWREFGQVIGPMERPVWISDSRYLRGFEPSTLALGARWFAAFRERGGRHCLVVSRWPVAIMAASTMALGLGVRIHSYATLEEAQNEAKKLLLAS